MSEKLSNEQISQLAVSGFAKGYNCAESLVMALKQQLKKDDLPINIATPFGAGLGGRRDLCGILTAGTMIIGLVYGRKDPANTEQKTKAYKAAGAYYRWFKQNFGAVMCRDIVPGKFTGHTKVCEDILGQAAIYLNNILQEKS